MLSVWKMNLCPEVDRALRHRHWTKVCFYGEAHLERVQRYWDANSEMIIFASVRCVHVLRGNARYL